MSSNLDRVRLVRVDCPACSRPLHPLPEDVIVFCGSCAGGGELGATAILPRPVLRPLAPGARSAADGGLWLPLWRLADAVAVPAFHSARPLTQTRWYSERIGALELVPAEGIPGLWGGSVGRADAREIAHLAGEPATEGSRAGSLPAPGPEPSLVAVPFRVETSRIVCAATGLHIYLETLPRAKEILSRWEACRA